jgi:beta-N-acetylhexosaminidase
MMALALAALCVSGACASPPPSTRLSSLTLEEKAAQVLLIGIEGSGQPSAESLALIGRLGVGGVVIFSFNMPLAPSDLGPYIAELQDAALVGGIPLIVAIDHEGGSVFRFKGPGITRIPPASEVGTRGPRYAFLLGRAAGAELRSLGVNMALAPVVELLTDRNKGFLGSRSYGREASIVDADAGAYIDGLQAEGVAAVAKHFPGNAGADPHKVLPKLDIAKGVYERDYLPRFASAIRHRVAAVMLSHVVFETLDPDRPASLSPAIIGGALRGELGFRGLAITDDLVMKALTESLSPESSAVAAIGAGADLLMLTNMRAAEGVRDALVAAVRDGRLPAARLDEAVKRILEVKKRFGMAAGLDPIIRARRLSAFASIVLEDGERIRAYRGTGSEMR